MKDSPCADAPVLPAWQTTPAAPETEPWRTAAAARTAAALALAAVLIVGFARTYLAVMSRPRFYDPSLGLDGRIPLEPAWVWVYLLYYPFCFAPLLFPALRRDMRVFLQVAGGFLIQFAAALPFFYFVPTRILHPSVVGGGLSAWALRLAYSIDSGYCVLPSLHVSNALYVWLLSLRLASKRLSVLLFLLFALISSSTLLVKQHYLLDVPAGLALGGLAYLISGRKA